MRDGKRRGLQGRRVISDVNKGFRTTIKDVGTRACAFVDCVCGPCLMLVVAMSRHE